MNTVLPNPRSILGCIATIIFLAIGAGTAAAQTGDLFTGFQSKSTDPVQIDAASLEISEQDKQRTSVFDGNVVVRRGETVLRAKTIRVFSDLSDKRPKNQAFSRIEASGNIEIKSGDQTVTSADVIVDMGRQTITLTGNVVLSQGSNVITGDRLIIDLASGKARVEQTAGKPIRGVFSAGAGALSQ